MISWDEVWIKGGNEFSIDQDEGFSLQEMDSKRIGTLSNVKGLLSKTEGTLSLSRDICYMNRTTPPKGTPPKEWNVWNWKRLPKKVALGVFQKIVLNEVEIVGGCLTFDDGDVEGLGGFACGSDIDYIIAIGKWRDEKHSI